MPKRNLNNRNYIIPKFEVNNNGFTLCKNHTDYEILKDSTYDYLFNFLTFKNLTCNSCQHYKSDDCFFPKTEIIKIMDDIHFLTNKFKCFLCKRRICNIFSILQIFKNKQLFNRNQYLVCYKCLKILNIKSPEKGFKDLFNLTLMYSLINLMGLIGFIFFIIFFSPMSSLLNIIFLSFIFLPLMFYFFIHYAKKALNYLKTIKSFESLYSSLI